jgi:putative copper export protein
MNIDEILKWVEASSLATRIRDGLLLFPLLEGIHVIGLAMVFGTIIIIDLRLLGKASTNRPFDKLASEILKWTWVGFAIAAVTGSLMFISNAGVYFHNTYFRIKILLLLLSGVNMFVFEVTARRTVKDWNTAPSAPRSGRTVGALSLIIWIGVIVTGRLIGFTTTRAAPIPPPPVDINFDDLFEQSPAEPPTQGK